MKTESNVLPLDLYSCKIAFCQVSKPELEKIVSSLEKGSLDTLTDTKKLLEAAKFVLDTINAVGKTKVQFLVNETDGNDVFAFFPEEVYPGRHEAIKNTWRLGYSQEGQHSGIHPKYAAESRPATEAEYKDLKKELEDLGYKLFIVQ